MLGQVDRTHLRQKTGLLENNRRASAGAEPDNQKWHCSIQVSTDGRMKVVVRVGLENSRMGRKFIMTNKTSYSLGVLVLAGSITFAGSALSQRAPLVTAGTLTCTLAPSEPGTESTARTSSQISCNFDRLVGADAGFDGTIKRIGADDERAAKVVLVWSVQAPQVDVDLRALEGRYVGSLPDATGQPNGKPENNTLIGGQNASIELRPLTPPQDIIPGAKLSVLDLRLALMKS